jgi:type II secretory pathway component PulK
MFGVCVCLFCVCVVLYLVSGLATSWSLVQGVLPSVKNDYGAEQEAWTLNGLEEPLKKKLEDASARMS